MRPLALTSICYTKPVGQLLANHVHEQWGHGLPNPAQRPEAAPVFLLKIPARSPQAFESKTAERP